VVARCPSPLFPSAGSRAPMQSRLHFWGDLIEGRPPAGSSSGFLGSCPVKWDRGFEPDFLQRGVNDEPVIDGYKHRRYHEGIDNLTPPTSTAGAAPYPGRTTKD
jgi:hypothetical protein